MQVEVYRDFACAWCRLSTHRFDRAIAAAGLDGVELVHRPFQLNPDADGSEEPRPLPEVMAEVFGDPARAESMFTNMERLGAAEGVEYHFDRALAVGTLPAHRLMWFAERESGAATVKALATAIYDAYFRDGGNIADPAELARLAASVGLDGVRAERFLRSDEGSGEVRRQAAEARANGVTGVPAYIFPGGGVLTGARETEELAAALRGADAS